MSTVTLAPHLQRALEVMSRDMGVEPQALVNQAVFAWLRINGYVLPGAVSAAAPAIAPQVASVVTFQAPPPAVAPGGPPAVSHVARAVPEAAEVPARPPPQAAPMRAEDVAPSSTPGAPASERAEEGGLGPVAYEAAPSPPGPDGRAGKVAPDERPASGGALTRARERMAAIAADLEAHTRPWPAWTRGGESADQEEEASDDSRAEAGASHQDEPLDADDREAVADAAENEQSGASAEAPADDGEADEGDTESPARVGAEDQDEPEDDDDEGPPLDDEEERAPTPPSGVAAVARAGGDEEDDAHGESEEPPPEEGTFVLKAAPFVLLIEREGEEPVRVESDVFTIGRDPGCDLVINSPRVSRVHVRLTRMGVTFVLEDQGSSNGTWLEGERISRRELESGDVIHLGNEPVKFVVKPV
jgi:hypothetical protein